MYVTLNSERDWRVFLGVSQVAENAEAVIFVLWMCISFGYLWNKCFLQFQFSCSRPWCIFQHSLFPSLAAQLLMYIFFFHCLGKMTEGNTKYLLLFPVSNARDWLAFFRVYCKAGCWLSSTLCIWHAHTTYYSHALFLSFFLEIGISFCIWDELTGNGSLLYTGITFVFQELWRLQSSRDAVTTWDL